MSLLRGFEKRSESITEAISRRSSFTASGVAVTPESAIRHSGVWGSTNLIADTVSTLPISPYRSDGRRLVKQPTQGIIEEPSAEVSFEDWLRQIIVSDLIKGNAWGLIVARDPKTMLPIQVEIQNPAVVTVQPRRRMEPMKVRVEGKPVDRNDIVHIPAYVMPGTPLGLSPIAVAAQSIGIGLAAEQYGAAWFGKGGHPSGILSSDQKIPDPETAETIRLRFKESVDQHGVGVLGLGMKYDSLQISPNESQFLETIDASISTIARFFGIAPEMIGGSSGDSMTYANVESRALAFLTFNLNHWIVRLEKHLSKLLPIGMVAKFNPDALVRVDLITRYNSHSIGLRNGFMNVNEVRELENRTPIDGGDEYVWPPLRSFPIPGDIE